MRPLSAIGLVAEQPAGSGGRALSQVGNSFALIAAKVASLGLGFVFWLLAARLFSRGDVGVAAALVSAMMLCTQLALLGIGSSIITHFRDHERDPERLVHSGLGIVMATSTLVAGVFLVLAAVALSHLDVVVRSPAYACAFVVAAVCGTVGTYLDQTSTALRRGDHALVRNVVFGLVTIAVLVPLGMGEIAGSGPIFLPWAAAGLAVCTVGAWQLRRSIIGFRARPSPDRGLMGSLVRVGLPNHALTLAERSPGLILPILVAELVSPGANAAWYAAWMMAWVAYIIPIQTGISAFAEVARDPDDITRIIERAIRTALLLGLLAALGLVVLAEPVLSLLGPGYAEDAAAPLRILALGVVPMSFTFAYYAACRGLRRPQHALGLAWTGVAAAVAAGAVAASSGGLTALAIAWVSVQAAMGACAAWRLRELRRAGAPARDGGRAVLLSAGAAPPPEPR